MLMMLVVVVVVADDTLIVAVRVAIEIVHHGLCYCCCSQTDDDGVRQHLPHCPTMGNDVVVAQEDFAALWQQFLQSYPIHTIVAAL